MPSTWFVDFLNGDDFTHTGLSFAQRFKTLDKAASSANAGDIVRVMGNASSNSGTATWTNNSSLVTLSSPLAQILYADGAWTPASGAVTCTVSTSAPSPKEGVNCSKMSFTSVVGKAAYFPFGTTLNLSTYQQISFWIRTQRSIPSGDLAFELCSDALGNTVVNTIPLNVTLQSDRWTNITIDNGSPLGAAIQSIRLKVGGWWGSPGDVFIDNIVACKAPTTAGCLTLSTLISPDNSTWYAIQSINGTSVYLDAIESTAAHGAPGFQGPTGTSTFYVLQPTVSENGTHSAQSFSTTGNNIVISGGWDNTAMATRNGWTTLDVMDWNDDVLHLSSTGSISLDHFNFVRAQDPLSLLPGSGVYSITSCTWTSCTRATSNALPGPVSAVLSACNFLNIGGLTEPAVIVTNPTTITNSNFWGCIGGGLSVNNGSVSGCSASGCVGDGFVISNATPFTNNTAKNNSSAGFNFSSVDLYSASRGPLVSYNLIAQGNGADIKVNGAAVEIYGLNTNKSGGTAAPQLLFGQNSDGKLVVYNWNQYTGVSPAAQICVFESDAVGLSSSSVAYSQKEGGVATNNSIFTDFGKVTTTGVVGESGSGIAWSLAPNSKSSALLPLRLNVGKIACQVGYTTKIVYWAKASAVSGINGQFKVFGGRYPGVGSVGVDIITPLTGGTSWSQYIVSVTPTESCEVDVFFESWGSTSQTVTVSGPIAIAQ